MLKRKFLFWARETRLLQVVLWKKTNLRDLELIYSRTLGLIPEVWTTGSKVSSRAAMAPKCQWSQQAAVSSQGMGLSHNRILPVNAGTAVGFLQTPFVGKWLFTSTKCLIRKFTGALFLFSPDISGLLWLFIWFQVVHCKLECTTDNNSSNVLLKINY